MSAINIPFSLLPDEQTTLLDAHLRPCGAMQARYVVRSRDGGITITLRDLATTVELYRDALTDIVESAIDARDLRSATSRMRLLVRGMAMQAFIEGMRDGGIQDAEGQIDDDDKSIVAEWIGNQIPHVAGFIKDVHAEGRTGDVLNRIELWVRSLETLGALGKASARENQVGTWRIGATEEHCTTCAMLDGQRHRVKWFTSKGYIPRQPGNEALECGGWNCDCGVYSDADERLL